MPSETVSIPAYRANLLSFGIFAALTVLSGFAFTSHESWAGFIETLGNFLLKPILIPVLAMGMFLHELIHILSWSILGKIPLSGFSIGFDLRQLSPYVTCRVRMPFNKYLAGALMPGILLGMAPFVFSLVEGNSWWTWFGIFFTAGAGGDFLSVFHLLRFRKSGKEVLDHPDNIGFIVYLRDQSPSNLK